MNKRIKLFGLLFVTIACTFFINDNTVKADGCNCYYKAVENIPQLNETSLTAVYLASFNYSSNSADVLKSCSSAHHSASAGTQSNTCTDFGVNLSRGNPFEVDSNGISQNGCSVESCQSANLKLCNDNTIRAKYDGEPECNGSNMTAISQSEFDELYNSKDTVSDATSSKLSGEDLNKIKSWGESETYDVSDLGNDCNVISGDIRDFLNNLLWIISIIGIILLIVMTAFEFVKVVTGQDDEGIKKAFKHTIIRIVCVVILLLLPMIVSSVITIINKNAGGTVQIGDNGSPTCQVGE